MSDKKLKVLGIGLFLVGGVISYLSGKVGDKQQERYINEAVNKAVEEKLKN